MTWRVLHFTVRDTGIGIPPEKQRAIFDASPRPTLDDAQVRRHGAGSGDLEQLVELMGGRIWVESEVGKGSTFHFTARFGLQQRVSPKRLAEPVELQDLPVLVVDDNATNRRILEEC